MQENKIEEELISDVTSETKVKDQIIVEIYSTPTCHYCHLAKDWMTEKGIKYVDHDVAADQVRGREMVEMTGQRGVPVIKIGNDVIIGFNQAKLEELLDVK